jgi:hypothetical protein
MTRENNDLKPSIYKIMYFVAELSGDRFNRNLVIRILKPAFQDNAAQFMIRYLTRGLTEHYLIKCGNYERFPRIE